MVKEETFPSGRSMLNVKAESPAGRLLRAQSGESFSTHVSRTIRNWCKKSSERQHTELGSGHPQPMIYGGARAPCLSAVYGSAWNPL